MTGVALDRSVGNTVLMATRAVRFHGMLGRWRDAPQDIRTVRHRLKVGGIHTRRVATQVVKRQSVWNRPNQLVIYPAVRELGLALAPDLSIPLPMLCALPEPALTVLRLLFQDLFLSEAHS